MSWRQLLQWALALYPRPWRHRYDDEVMATVEDLLGGGHARPARLLASLLWGALKEQWRPSIPAQPAVGSYAGSEALMRHRNWVKRRRELDPGTLAFFERGEVVYATFDGYKAFPRCHRAAVSGLLTLALVVAIPTVETALTGLPFNFDFNSLILWSWLGLAVFQGGLLVIAMLGGWSRRMLAATSLGLVVLRLNWLGRPQEIVGRQPAVVPEVVRRNRTYSQVRFGQRSIWIRRDDDVVVRYMGAVAA